MENIQEEIGARLKEIRNKYADKRKLSAAEFGELLGESKYNIGNYERGIASVPNRTLLALLNLGFNVNWLISGRGEPILSGGAKYPAVAEERLTYKAKVDINHEIESTIKYAMKAAAGDIAKMIKEELK
jgi:transcriptional regulator with XRE-family HTH domain